MNTVEDMTLLEYMTKWFNTSMSRMAARGVTVDLTFRQFIDDVVTARQYASLQKTKEAGWLNSRQHRDNPMAYVITWKSYSARTSNVLNVDTVCFCTRAESRQRSKPVKGEALRDAHKSRIAAKMTGKEKAEEHREKIGEALTGRTLSAEHKANLKRPKQPWSEERKAAARKAAMDRAAAKRAMKGGAQ